MFLSFPCYVVLSFVYQVILILCIFLFCSFCILLFAHSRQRKLNLFHWGTIFSISFVHLSLKNKKLNLFHPILNIGQGSLAIKLIPSFLFYPAFCPSWLLDNHSAHSTIVPIMFSAQDEYFLGCVHSAWA